LGIFWVWGSKQIPLVEVNLLTIFSLKRAFSFYTHFTYKSTSCLHLSLNKKESI
jgi:hypothetical protein